LATEARAGMKNAGVWAGIVSLRGSTKNSYLSIAYGKPSAKLHYVNRD
jgi:hypothetical protein